MVDVHVLLKLPVIYNNLYVISKSIRSRRYDKRYLDNISNNNFLGGWWTYLRLKRNTQAEHTFIQLVDNILTILFADMPLLWLRSLWHVISDWFHITHSKKKLMPRQLYIQLCSLTGLCYCCSEISTMFIKSQQSKYLLYNIIATCLKMI